MADQPKFDDKGGGSGVSFATTIDTLEQMIQALQEQIRPIQEKIQVLEVLLQDRRDRQFLAQRRQERAAKRQATDRPAGNPARDEEFLVA